MEINLQGKVTHAKVYESVILSDYRLTYREIDEIVQTQDKSSPDLLRKLSPSSKGTNRVSLMEGDVTSVTEGAAIE